MIAAGFRPRGIDGTAAGSAIKKDAVATGHSGEGERLAFRMKMFDNLLFYQFFGYKKSEYE